MAVFRTVQAKIEFGNLRQVLDKADWSDEEITHLIHMYYIGIENADEEDVF